ncbi:MAG: TfoX/Sxy family protein [Deltaproteobacteria bacterium]|nr:TfoX/Sxy family protein [Deltaproteobacteria bacterium]
MAYDEALAERVRRALESEKSVVEKKMFGGIAFLQAGKMSVGILGKDLVVRVDPKEQDKFLRYPGVRPMDFTGRPMRGFLYVGPKATASGASLASWVRRGLTFAKSLPAKKKTASKKRKVRL